MVETWSMEQASVYFMITNQLNFNSVQIRLQTAVYPFLYCLPDQSPLQTGFHLEPRHWLPMRKGAIYSPQTLVSTPAQLLLQLGWNWNASLLCFWIIKYLKYIDGSLSPSWKWSFIHGCLWSQILEPALSNSWRWRKPFYAWIHTRKSSLMWRVVCLSLFMCLQLIHLLILSIYNFSTTWCGTKSLENSCL